ncbi:expressed unknown protein [Seminavis robusta]|uniref:Uncharacterized protein n=1 Tax=Seminavis robusta TaxID=568900 RepID=A0A9N8EI52_9STRA|nr:expressed unknown protein [Seminavis robusta]|eukprot:Sro1119_g243140.1 n/a (173) ;mRNA; r:5042-5560
MKASATILGCLLIGVSESFVLRPLVPPRTASCHVLSATNQHHEFKPDSYHKGGNSRYTAPVVEPARLNMDGGEEEECLEPFIDHATGDELCWNEEPTHPRNVIANKETLVDSSSSIPTRFVSPDVADDYHKGGNALYQATDAPTKLDEECETPFMDFVSGDELCWNDYDMTA